MFNSRGRLVVLAAGLLLAGFLGIMLASQSVDEPRRPSEATEAGGLRPGTILPDIAVTATDGMETGLLAFARDGDLIVLLLSADCGPCDSVVAIWSREPKLPGLPRVVGVYSDKLDRVRSHTRYLAANIPLLCDTAQVLISRYAMMSYPIAIGVQRGGRIAYIRHGLAGDFDPAAAAEALRQTR